MTPRFRHVLRLSMVLALAMSQFEPRPLLRTVEMFRGYALQVVARRVTGHVLATPNNTAVLVWSEVRAAPGQRLLSRAARGTRNAMAVLAATCVGLALFLASNALLIVPIQMLMNAVGLSAYVPLVALVIAVGRLSLTLARALAAYRLERRREQFLLPVGTAPIWRLDLLGAAPAGRGYGGELTRVFVERADHAGAVVYLVTDKSNRSFYRRHGFRVVEHTDSDTFRSLLLMRRLPRVQRGTVPLARRSAHKEKRRTDQAPALLLR
ncbi:MAG: hypothetical protein M3Z02_00830 [Actinomycetota bacterium]|nr:hypothetical protein [Actinomycetota bacterium]